MSMLVLVNNLKINYEEKGAGETLLLLHGWENNLTIWNEITPLLNNYRVVRLDLPGFGKSDLPPKAWNVSDYAEFLNRFLEKLNISKTIIIGHSFGGRIAIKFSVLYPEKVSKLILVDSGGIRLKTPKKFIAFTLAKLGKIFFCLPLIKVQRDKIREKFYKTIKAEDYFNISSPIIKNSFVKIINEDLRIEAKKIKSETLIIWGEKDNETSLKDAFVFHGLIKDSKLKIIKDAGHFPFLDKKEEFLNILRGFI